MKYAKSDKGYYVPKGQSPETQTQQAAQAGPGPAAGLPTSGDTSLSFEDAGYKMTKDNFGNDLYIPTDFQKSSTLDWNASKGDRLFMKSWAYKKGSDGTFIPVIYDAQANKIDESMTKEMDVNTLGGGFNLTGSGAVKAEDVGKLLYKRAVSPYQTGEMGKFVSQAQQKGGGTLAPTTPGQRIMVDTRQ